MDDVRVRTVDAATLSVHVDEISGIISWSGCFVGTTSGVWHSSIILSAVEIPSNLLEVAISLSSSTTLNLSFCSFTSSPSINSAPIDASASGS